MARTTVDLDPTILKELKARALEEGKTLGALISELASTSLKARGASAPETRIRWTSRPMGLKVDLRDKEAVYDLLDGV